MIFYQFCILPLVKKRWRALENGQLHLKQNLVKFNNFVKEKRLKIEEGNVRSKKHFQVKYVI